MEEQKQKVVCYGEILWDNLPAGRKPGGAPMNVAYHLRQLGIESCLVSKVGNDFNGKDLLRFIEGKGIDTRFCQLDMHFPTSTVEVSIAPDKEVSYDIVTKVAWDYIENTPETENLVKESDAFVFGSLATRSVQSYLTLHSLLEKASYKVFDVNLRQPHFSEPSVSQLLRKTDLLKLNMNELKFISAWFSPAGDSEWERIKVLQDRFAIKEIIVTKGSNGSTYYTEYAQCNYPAFKVEVNDTVGSGDSFLAAFLYQKLTGNNIEETLKYASALGAYVTTKEGACPEYKPFDIQQFMWNNKIQPINQILH